MRAPTCIAFPFVHSDVTGATISTLNLVKQIDQDRFQPFVILHDVEGPLVSVLEQNGVSWQSAPVSTSVAGGARMLWTNLRVLTGGAHKMAQILRQRKVKIVHTNDRRAHVTWMLPGRMAGAKLVWHQRGQPYGRRWQYLSSCIPDRVIAVSRFAAPRLTFGASTRCTAIDNPFNVATAEVDRATARRDLLHELGCPPETFVLGFFGHLGQRKRPLTFVEAIAALRARAPSLPVAGALFGRGRHDERQRLEIRKHAEGLGVDDCIHLMGFRYPPEKWMAACDVLLATSVNEPLGRTIIEAMLLGTPVLATCSGGNPEIIQARDTGILVPPDDAKAFAEKALMLHQDPEGRAGIVQRARGHARARFSAERHAQEMMKLYELILAS